jgi:hypothetical protein
VKNDRSGPEHFIKSLEINGLERVDQRVAVWNGNLDETQFLMIAMKTVAFGIDRDLWLMLQYVTELGNLGSRFQN